MRISLPLAIAALLVAHFIRGVRQANLFAAGEQPRVITLMVGLSIAFVINAIIPFRLGEIARAVYVAIRANIDVGRVLATIVAERLSDLVAVFVGLVLLAAISGRPVQSAAVAVIAGGIVATVAVVGAVRRSKAARRMVWCATSILNDRLRDAIADFAWSAARLVTVATLARPRYLALTAAMWAVYLAAYAAFARAMGFSASLVIETMVDSPLRSLIGRSREMGGAVVLFASLTALLILVLGIAGDWRGIERAVARVRRLGMPLVSSPDLGLRKAFIHRADHSAMLRSHFTSADPLVATFGLHGLGDAIVHRILPGGSDAITSVVEIDARFGIRKFATGGAAAKLIEQAAWLDRHAHRLPVATVIDRRGDANRFRYDMPYHPGARDLYEVVHTAPLKTCIGWLETVVAGVAGHHLATASGPCTRADLERYVDRKIVANARESLAFARLQLPERYRINDQPFAMAEWAPLLDRDWLLARFRMSGTAAIHGDLTVENIVVCPEHPLGWYLIDPNPTNLFNSPLIDWAKLMQSLNLGYEMLNRGAPPRVQGDTVTLLLAKSRVYADLHGAYTALLASRFDATSLREIDLHEIVNYLRLIPYQIRRQPARAMAFFAGASLLLRRFAETVAD